MRPQSMLRAAPTVGLAGAFAIVSPAAVGAPAAAAAATDTPGASVQAKVHDARLRYGAPIAVTGHLASGRAGVPVRLEFRAAGASAWSAVRSSTTTRAGRFALRAPLPRSGAVRVVDGSAALATAAAVDSAAAGAAAPPTAASTPQPVRVRGRIDARHVARHVRAGRPVRVRGVVHPGDAGRTVSLQLRRRGHWRTVDRDRTGSGGRFALRERLPAATSAPARIRYAGGGGIDAGQRRIGRLNAYRSAFASWYGPGLYGNHLGCGGTLTAGTIGVANKSLPCGTKLTLRYRGHSVRARVVDRGPYVAGREFDLTSATKARLHFGSTGWIQVSR